MMWGMKDLFVVTGAAGFIGRNLVAGLNERGIDHILLVDQLGRDEKWKNLRGLAYEDILDVQRFREMVLGNKLDRVEAIFHMGACSATTERDADYLVDNNYRVTRELASWCLENQSRFIYASSAATYGNGEFGYSDRDEDTPKYRPLNMYGYSKHLFDLWALKHGYFQDLVGLKFFNVYGPYEDHKEDMRSVIHKAYHQILEGGEVELFQSHREAYEDGEQVRDFIYVKDVVEQCLWYYDHQEVSGLFNVGTGKARSWNDLVKAVFSAMGREPNIRYIPMPEGLREKYQYHTEADMEKVRQSGYDLARTSLEDGVKDYVQNYLMKL